jgi:hypothetical protein
VEEAQVRRIRRVLSSGVNFSIVADWHLTMLPFCVCLPSLSTELFPKHYRIVMCVYCPRPKYTTG